MTQAPERPSRERTIEELAEALDEAARRRGRLDPEPRRVLEDTLGALDELHRRALVSVVRRLRDDPRGKELLFELVDEPEVRMVLAMHEIIRPDPATAARAALEQVRPSLQAHGGDVALDRVEGPVAHVRLEGACNGCSMAAVTMRESVEQALIAGVPGIRAVEVVAADPGPTLVPLSEVRVRERGSDELEAAGWRAAVAVADVAPGGLVACTVRVPGGADLDLVAVHAAGRLSAYLNACAHQGLPLDDAEVDDEAGTITCSWHGFCFDAASGECTSMPGAQLAPLPSRVVDGVLWVRPESAPQGA